MPLPTARAPCSSACGPAPLGRRDFVQTAARLAAGAVLAACGDGPTATAPATVAPHAIRVAAHPELATIGGVALVAIDGSPVAIVRTGPATFVALSRVCPHQGATVSAASGGFTCPRHGARFDQTGTWIGGQRTSNLRTYPATYDAASGAVTIG